MAFSEFITRSQHQRLNMMAGSGIGGEQDQGPMDAEGFVADTIRPANDTERQLFDGLISIMNTDDECARPAFMMSGEQGNYTGIHKDAHYNLSFFAGEGTKRWRIWHPQSNPHATNPLYRYLDLRSGAQQLQ